MAEPRAKTLQERFGFKGIDLAKQGHDDIMLWLDANAETIVREKGWWKRPSHPLPDGMPGLAIEKKVWEHPISTGYDNKFVVGFVDLRCEVEYPAVWEDEQGRPIWGRDGYTLHFEVKTSIRSAGELIRQIRLYQAHDPEAKYAVVCPDDRFADILHAQGIGFVKAPEAL